MESLHYLLMKTHSMLSRGILSEAAKIGLTPGQPKILEFLLAKTEADQKTIAAYCEIEPATVGSILLRMEDAGLVVRRQHAGNRRSLYVSLTESGQQAAMSMEHIFEQQEDWAIADLAPEEVQHLKITLRKMCATMSDASYRKKD